MISRTFSLRTNSPGKFSWTNPGNFSSNTPGKFSPNNSPPRTLPLRKIPQTPDECHSRWAGYYAVYISNHSCVQQSMTLLKEHRNQRLVDNGKEIGHNDSNTGWFPMRIPLKIQRKKTQTISNFLHRVLCRKPP